jgi:hypothetical protein
LKNIETPLRKRVPGLGERRQPKIQSQGKTVSLGDRLAILAAGTSPARLQPVQGSGETVIALMWKASQGEERQSTSTFI